jgi:hypothetical protein
MAIGMAMFRGGAIAVFSADITARAGAFLKDSAPTIVRTDRIEGQNVAVFKQKSEEDIWTTYVGFPKPNMAVVATDEDYLREIRRRGIGQSHPDGLGGC